MELRLRNVVLRLRITARDWLEKSLIDRFVTWIDFQSLGKQFYRDGRQSEFYFYLLRTAINDKVEKSRENYSNPLLLVNFPAV